MTVFALYIVINYTILFPAITGAIRFNSIHSDFYPFIILMWVKLINETVSLAMVYSFGTNSITTNTYVLIEYLLLLFQFSKWSKDLEKACYILAGFGLLVWLADHFVINTLNSNTSIFRLFYFLVIFLLGLRQVNNIINSESHSILKNPVFLVCAAFLVYYSCRALVEVVNLFILGSHNTFNLQVFMIVNVANFFSYIIYTIAILCIPGKQECIIQY
jgi:hypothetical protein